MVSRHLARLVALALTAWGLGCGEESEKTCGSNADALGEPACCSQCPLDASRCDEKPFSSYPNFERAKKEFRQWCPNTSLLGFVVTGSCSNGNLILQWSSGYGGETRYFDARGRFLGLFGSTDTRASELCGSTHYWPELVDCDPIVGSGENLCL
jgi:hypothetical protein